MAAFFGTSSAAKTLDSLLDALENPGSSLVLAGKADSLLNQRADRAWRLDRDARAAAELRAAQLEGQVDELRAQLAENEAEREGARVRFDLVNRAASEGMWDMTVVAGDPINAKNEFWWSDQFRAMLVSATSATSPTAWAAGPTGCIPRTSRPRWTPSRRT